METYTGLVSVSSAFSSLFSSSLLPSSGIVSYAEYFVTWVVRPDVLNGSLEAFLEAAL